MSDSTLAAPGWAATRDASEIDQSGGGGLSVSRRTALQAGGLLGLLGVAQPAAAQQSFEDAACEKRGDTDFNGNDAINVGTIEFAGDGSTLSSAPSGGGGGGTTDTRVETQDSGATVYSDTSVLNFNSGFSVTDSGSGAVDVSASSSIDLEAAGGTISSASALGSGRGIALVDDGDGTGTLSKEPGIAYDPGMTNWGSGLSDEEVARLQLQSGETLDINRIEFRSKGGGTNSSVSVDVHDATAASTIGSQTLGGMTFNPGSSGTGNLVQVRISTGSSSVTGAPRVIGSIDGGQA